MNGIHQAIFVIIIDMTKSVAWLLQKARIISDDITLRFLLQQAQIFLSYNINTALTTLLGNDDFF
ncbi:hypothetical protein D3C76_988710 [compost metagenome]